MSALRQRVITAAVLGSLALCAIIVLSTPYFSLVLGVVILAGAWEWAALAGWGAPYQRALYVLALALGLLGAWVLMQGPVGFRVIMGVGLLWWLIALVLVWRYQSRGTLGHGPRLWRGGAGWLVMIPAWASLVALHGAGEQGVYRVLFLLALIAGADITAFFVGRRWGRTRLASRVSPGKSWEGVAGALAAVFVLAGAAGTLAGLGGSNLAIFLGLCLLTALASVLGDLTESLFKREAGLKDSGHLLPGHGGVLDRIDSLTAAAPLFALGIRWLGVQT